ncbi:ankyrin repeat-containing domain protein [Mrakia frigida]|uniref:uncharacterized protein n=1 Tax=Mrakia frigida TaxID=29902 RepID=UPI003FCC019D
MTSRASEIKNIWIAAGDGDVERVKELVESGISANAPDPNTYTPMHAAASYDQRDVLTYLLSQGGLINVTDQDGDTPLYTVESVEGARWLIEHGAEPTWKNGEGLSPAAHLQEDFPLVASYLRTITNEPAPIPSASDTIDEDDEDEELDEGEDEEEDADMSAELSADNLSSLMAERLTEEQTSVLMEQFAEVMRKCEEDGINRDEELKQMVEAAIFQTVDAGRTFGAGPSASSSEPAPEAPSGGEGNKRSRTEPGR